MKNWILVVEDEPDIRDAIKSYLEMTYGEGLEVIEAKDGLEATTKLHFQAFSCIITDINMPRKNGWKLIEEARQSTLNSKTPIIAITGHSVEPQDKKFDVEMLYKPFSIQDLINMVDDTFESGNQERVAADLINHLTEKSMRCLSAFSGVVADQGQPFTKPGQEKFPGQFHRWCRLNHGERVFDIVICFEQRLMDYLEVHHLSEKNEDPIEYLMSSAILPAIETLSDQNLNLESAQGLSEGQAKDLSVSEAIIMPMATNKGNLEFALIKSVSE